MNPVPPVPAQRGEPHVRRFDEQRWLLDNVIAANGIDWDQPRSRYLNAPCGVEAITDEAAFDAFRQTITWVGHAERIRVPYLCVAGEADELSPLVHSRRLVGAVAGPRQMVVYQDWRHSVGNVPATNLGPFPPVLVADWMADRLAGQPFASERWYVTASGAIERTPL